MTPDLAPTRPLASASAPGPRPSPRGRAIVLLLICLAAVLLRVPNIGGPPVGFHSWRQADTAAIARNYVEEGTPFHLPKIDWGRPGPGFVETELPLYPYAASLAYRAIGGVDHRAARWLAIAASILTLLALYRLVAEEVGPVAGLWAACFFAALPLSAYYGRAIMPEPWMLCAGVGGLYFFARWSRGGRDANLLAAFAAITLAALLKLPMLHYGLPLAFLAIRRLGPRAFLDARMWLFAIATLACTAVWYVHAAWIRETYHLSFGISGSTKWGDLGVLFCEEFFRVALIDYLLKGHLAVFGLPLLALGVLWPTQRRRVALFDAWLLAFVVYLAITARGNILHEYYQLPVVPALCASMGRACWILGSWLGPAHHARWRVLAAVALFATLSGMAVVGTRTHLRYARMADPARSVEVRLGDRVQAVSQPGELIIVANHDGSWDPTLLYLSHRKGWADHPRFMGPKHMEARIASGARWLVGLDEHFWREDDRRWLDVQRSLYEDLSDDPAYFVLRLEAGRQPGCRRRRAARVGCCGCPRGRVDDRR